MKKFFIKAQGGYGGIYFVEAEDIEMAVLEVAKQQSEITTCEVWELGEPRHFSISTIHNANEIK